MRIVMESQIAQIGIRSKPSQVSINQKKADVNIENQHAKVQVEMSLPKVKIDQSQSFSESGLKGVQSFSDSNVAYANQKRQETLRRMSEEGNQFADIHKSKNVIAENADYNAWGQFKKEWGLVTMPSSGPNITVLEGDLDIKVNEGKVKINVKTNKPQIDYQAGSVETYLKKRNYLKIDVRPDRFDMKA